LDKYSFLEEQKKIFKKWVILLQRTWHFFFII
jgi:hypothetical protein